LIRRKAQGEAFALTAPLIKKADGSKFGKSEGGNIWLDPERTSPYKFYQYWLNSSDEDAENYIKIFTLKGQDEIEKIIKEHQDAPHSRVLQKALAKDITIRVHSEEAYKTALTASNILFGKSTEDDLRSLPEGDFLSVFEGVPQAEVAKSEIEGMNIVDALSVNTGFLKSNGEARRALKENSISVNKVKVKDDFTLDAGSLLNEKYVLLQRGKKNYFLLIAK